MKLRSCRFLLSCAVLVATVRCEEKVPEPEPWNVETPKKPPAAKSDDSKTTTLPAAASAASDAGESVPADGAAPTDLVIDVVKEGKGRAVKTGDTVKVHYTGTLFDGGKKFDSSRDRDEPFRFTLGRGMVIKGWDQGVVGMKKGGRRKLTIPPDKAYGKAGRPPKIPPNSTLVFDIELVEIVGG